MADNIIPFPVDTSSNLSCPNCDSQWFDVKGVVLDHDMRVIGYAMPFTCQDCGRELHGTAS